MQEANVSIHGCTEYEVLSLDAGLRMDNLLAFDLWDVVVEVSRSSKITESSEQQETARELTNPNPNRRETETLINCRMWTMSPQTHTLLKVSLSWYNLKITKL